MLTQAYLQRLLDYDPVTGVFRWRITRSGYINKGRRAGYKDSRGYRIIMLKGKSYKEHRLAWFYVYGVWPSETIDHINKNVSNNSITELRLATYTQNQWNKGKYKNNTSGYKGVSKILNKWRARIKINKKTVHLGYFNTPQQAHAAYVAAANKHFGTYARYA